MLISNTSKYIMTLWSKDDLQKCFILFISMIRYEASTKKNFHIKSYSEYTARFASHPWHINENDKEWESMLNCLMNTVVPCPDNFDKLPARRKRIKHSVLIVNADLSQIFILIQKFIKRIPSKWYIRGKS